MEAQEAKCNVLVFKSKNGNNIQNGTGITL